MAGVLPVPESPIREIRLGFTTQFVTSQFKVDQQQYADDTQVFISLSKINSSDQVSRLETALVHLTSWVFHNGLPLNPEMSQAIILGTHPRNKSLDNITHFDVNGSPILISDNIRLLGATNDSSLAFNKHVSLFYDIIWIMLLFTNNPIWLKLHLYCPLFWTVC